ncbi:MAG: hypothetical protein ACI9FN_003047 [Saprospiraceae bacterium]
MIQGTTSSMKLRYIQGCILTLLCILTFSLLDAQQIRTEFGKNRVQYHDDFEKWWMYETENFIVYWYGKGRNIAQSAIQIAEQVHPNIQNLVEHRINDKIEIIVYTDLSDLLQSNIGSEETFETKHGSTKVIGSRLFVYFDGNHQNLERDIKEGVAQVYLNAMYSKGSLQEVVDSDPDLMVPDWYREGFTSYAGADWDSKIEDEFRDLWHIHKKKYKKFNRLAADHPRVAGHTMWHYLATKYGQNSITTLLYLMRLRNDLDENVEFIFGFDVKRLKADWGVFYRNLYSKEEAVFDSLNVEEAKDLGYKRYWPKTHFRLSPDGERLIYTVNQEGKYKVILEDQRDQSRKVIFKYGSKNAVQEADYNYPQVAWHPSRDEITICYEKRDLIMLRRVDLTNDQYVEQDIPENIQRIYSIDYVTDDEYMINGLTDGFSDLYIYGSRYRQAKPITEDFYDDINASYVQFGEQWGILFSSNRPNSTIIPQDLDTILPTSNFDVFFLPLESEFALRLTNTPVINELQPRLVNDHFLTYLDNKTGINNRYTIDLNSRRPPYANSNLPRNIINHDAVKNSDRYIMQTYQNGAYEVYDIHPNWRESVKPFLTASATYRAEVEEVIAPLPTKEEKEIASGQLFQSKFSDPEAIEPLESNSEYDILERAVSETFKQDTEDIPVVRFVRARAVAARRQFKLEDISTTLDNEVLFDGLSSYTDDRREQEAQQPGLLIKATTKDIFEDFKIDLGVRIPTSFNGSEFFAVMDDRRRRIDKRYAIYRKQEGRESLGEPFFGFPSLRQREIVWIGLHRLSYPFDTYRSVRLTGQLRSDQRFLLHSTPKDAAVPDVDEKRVSIKLEYVFDNTLDIDLNLRHGTKYKFYAEAINRFDIQIGRKWNFEASRGNTFLFGFDGRHYESFLRNSIIALRAAGATSFGSDRMLYYIGGTDGWISPGFNQDIPVPNENFAFKTVAPNLRGFNTNIRNGRSFVLGSAELRIPIFKYLSRKELKSAFFRNIQATAFIDAGSAWHGFVPSIRDNPLNRVTLQQQGVEVTLNLDRSTFVYGYGFGARINLLGYFIRADYAWGVESGLVQDPKLYISLGTDF